MTDVFSTDQNFNRLTCRKKTGMERSSTIQELELVHQQCLESKDTCMSGNAEADLNSSDEDSRVSRDQRSSFPDLDETSGDNENYDSNDDNDEDDMHEMDAQLRKSLMNHLSERKEAHKNRRIARKARLKAKREQERIASEAKLATRAKAREMSPSQEMWNVVTMIPCPVYFAFFILAGCWLKDEDVHQMREHILPESDMYLKHQGGDEYWSFTSVLHGIFFNDDRCINIPSLPRLHALPPAPLFVAAIGATLHAPCSMLYHSLCACYLPSGSKRMDHWSRRLDQAMIHFVSICWCYGSSENRDFHIAAALFNIDSMYRLFQKTYRPRSLLIRMALAFVLPAFPFLVRGDILSFVKLIMVYAASFWLFAKYPFGGKFQVPCERMYLISFLIIFYLAFDFSPIFRMVSWDLSLCIVICCSYHGTWIDIFRAQSRASSQCSYLCNFIGALE